MEPSPEAPNELALLLQRVTALPPETHVLVLRHLPVPELARLSCVHKAFRVAWQQLRREHPGGRFDPPTAQEVAQAEGAPRLLRAAWFGDVAVIRSMVAAGVDEHGVPLQEATHVSFGGVGWVQLAAWARGDTSVPYSWDMRMGYNSYSDTNRRSVDMALTYAAGRGHLQAVELLLGYGVEHTDRGHALREASKNGHAAVVQLLIQHGADVHAEGDLALRWASQHGHTAVVQLLLQNGLDVPFQGRGALRLSSLHGHTAVVELLLQHGLDVHDEDNDGRQAVDLASFSGHAEIVELLIQHGARPPSQQTDW
jgi:hypothetical protein